MLRPQRQCGHAGLSALPARTRGQPGAGRPPHGPPPCPRNRANRAPRRPDVPSLFPHPRGPPRTRVPTTLLAVEGGREALMGSWAQAGKGTQGKAKKERAGRRKGPGLGGRGEAPGEGGGLGAAVRRPGKWSRADGGRPRRASAPTGSRHRQAAQSETHRSLRAGGRERGLDRLLRRRRVGVSAPWNPRTQPRGTWWSCQRGETCRRPLRGPRGWEGRLGRPGGGRQQVGAGRWVGGGRRGAALPPNPFTPRPLRLIPSERPPT